MSTTPVWVPLVVAGIAVLGTLSGVIAGTVVTQRQADRREDKTWARENEARTFEHRREAYADFYEALQAMARMAYLHGSVLTEDLPDDWYSEAFGKLSRLSLYADRRVAIAASNSYTAAWNWGEDSKRASLNETLGVDDELEQFNKGWGEYQRAELKLLVLMRDALSIPEGDLTLPPPRPSGAPDGFAPEEL